MYFQYAPFFVPLFVIFLYAENNNAHNTEFPMMISFSEFPACFLFVPLFAQPPSSATAGGFSISTWIRLTQEETDGFLLAKTSGNEDGTGSPRRQYYALRLTTLTTDDDFSSVTLRFRYSVPGNLVSGVGGEVGG